MSFWKPNLQPWRTYFKAEGWRKDFEQTGEDLGKIVSGIYDKAGIAGVLAAGAISYVTTPITLFTTAGLTGERDIWIAAGSYVIALGLSVKSFRARHIAARKQHIDDLANGKLPPGYVQPSYQTDQNTTTTRISTSNYPYAPVDTGKLLTRRGIPLGGNPSETFEEIGRSLRKEEAPSYKVLRIDGNGKTYCVCETKQ